MPDAYNILHRNVYGWFVAIERGVYDLTETGRRALLRWPQMVSPPDLENPVIDASRPTIASRSTQSEPGQGTQTTEDRTDGAMRQKAKRIGSSLKLAPQPRVSAKNG